MILFYVTQNNIIMKMQRVDCYFSFMQNLMTIYISFLINQNQQNILSETEFKLNQNMSTGVNQFQGKSFNVFLRMFQLGCQVILGYWASKHEGTYEQCDYTIPNIISYIAYGLAFLNLLLFVGAKCSKNFPRILFYVFFLLDLAAAATIIALQFTRGQQTCAAGKVFFQFSVIQAAIAIVVSFVILVMKLAWGNRYTNSPGNLVWPIIFLVYQWTANFSTPMLVIGITTAVISGITFLINLSTLCRTTSSTIKAIKAWWIFAIILLLGLEVLAIVWYLKAGQPTEYRDVQAKRTLGVFVLVNALDILLWIYGLGILDERNYHFGDSSHFGGDQLQAAKSNLKNQQSIIASRNTQKIQHPR